MEKTGSERRLSATATTDGMDQDSLYVYLVAPVLK